MLLSVQHVRTYAAFKVFRTHEFGDGPGAENPVSCDGANRMVLFVTVSDALANFEFNVHYFAEALDSYRDTVWAGGAAPALVKKLTYNLGGPAATRPGAQFVISAPVHAPLALVSVAAGSSASDRCAITAATATTLGGEGRSWGPFLVKTAGPPVGIGDGPGGENPVPIHDASRLVLLVDADLATNARLDATMETSVDGLTYHRETAQTGTFPIELWGRTYQFSQSLLSDKSSVAVPIDALGAFARFTFAEGVATVNSAAARAIVGRR